MGLVAVLVASLAALLPSAAYAHDYGLPGLNGAQINITPDGYDEVWHPTGRSYEVEGKSFKPLTVAHIFQCQAGAVDLIRECQPLGVAQTDATGAFPKTSVYMRETFSNTSKPVNIGVGNPEVGGVICLGWRGVQCSVVAATFGPDLQPTAKAEHYICFQGRYQGPGTYETHCEPRPTA